MAIYTDGEIWTPSIETHPQLGVDSLCINIADDMESNDKVTFVLGGLTGEHFDTLEEKFICQESVEIVAAANGSFCFGEYDDDDYDDELVSRLFVGGLFVCDLGENYRYSWSFAPNVIELDRDRKSASGFYVDLEATRMLAAAGEYNLIASLAQSGSKDVSEHYQACGGYITTTGDKDNSSIQDFATENFIKEYGDNAYPIDANGSASINKVKTRKCISLGLEPVVVPSQFYVLLSKDLKTDLSGSGKKIIKASDALLELLDNNKKHMRSKASRAILSLIEDLQLSGM